MNTSAFRHFYEYHFAENRSTWDRYIVPLTQTQFTQNAGYSHGSVCSQIVHLINVDEVWFSALRGEEMPESLDPAAVTDRATLRTYWDGLEQKMRSYLAGLQDEMLSTKPFAEGEDKDLLLWQVLLHVVNHGTDHRAQLLRLLHDLGVKTTSQDYIFYVYDHPE
ncbi:MAG TPA: DinB family protein [Longilinea sp.]|nr:DinB family protein [Longilinea sp.]